MSKIFWIAVLIIASLSTTFTQSYNQLTKFTEELIEQRTEYAKYFVHPNKTKSIRHSSAPLHYRAEDGNWEEIEYVLHQQNAVYKYPKQNHIFQLDTDNLSFTIRNATNKIGFEETEFVFIDHEGQEISRSGFSENRK